MSALTYICSVHKARTQLTQTQKNPINWFTVLDCHDDVVDRPAVENEDMVKFLTPSTSADTKIDLASATGKGF